MANVLRNPYSNTVGNVPSSLSNGQIGVNQADGRLFYRASNGTVTQFSGGGSSSLAAYASVSAFPATGSESVLYLDESTSRLYQWDATVYVEVGGSGGGVSHAATHAIGGGDAITITAAQVSDFATAAAAAAPVVSVAGRTGAVAITSADVSGLGSLATQSSVAYSSLTGVPSSFTPSTHASSHAAGGGDPLTLTASQISDFSSSVASSIAGGANQVLYKNASNNTAGSSGLTFNGTDLSLGGKLNVNASSGDEGGELFLAAAQTNTTLSGGVTVDVYQNRLRFFEQGGAARGYFLDISSASGSAGTSIVGKTLARFTARDNQPPAANFATIDTRNSVLVLEFDAATEESAAFVGVINENATLANGLTVRLWWMGDTATSGNVRWGVQFEKTGTDMDADSYDTNAQATSAANATSGIESVASITITTIDSLAAGDRFRLRVYRVAADATNDTMTGDAQLVAVEVRAA